MDAIVLANALVYATPSSDRSGISSKQKTWEKFINSLDWDSVPKEKKTQAKNVLGMFKKLGMVPILNKKR